MAQNNNIIQSFESPEHELSFDWFDTRRWVSESERFFTIYKTFLF